MVTYTVQWLQKISSSFPDPFNDFKTLKPTHHHWFCRTLIPRRTFLHMPVQLMMSAPFQFRLVLQLTHAKLWSLFKVLFYSKVKLLSFFSVNYVFSSPSGFTFDILLFLFRFLRLLSEYDWKFSPMIIDINGDITAENKTEINVVVGKCWVYLLCQNFKIFCVTMACGNLFFTGKLCVK